MEEYWSSLLTEKSWKILQDLRRSYDFILIGGWAVYLHTKQHKSKDIDIVVSIKELEALKNRELRKNDSLRKYEIKNEEIDVDIYVEYYSKLTVPVEEIKNYVDNVEGFNVVKPEILVLLKQGAFESRKNSIKGEKDKIDIVSLVFFSDFKINEYECIAKKYKLERFIYELKEIVVGFVDYDYLGLKPQELKRMKTKFMLEWRKSV